ncbi:META and DUF4377 domain-containing protein [Stenotrophomonas sp. C3(2023)]|uniref:META and DUF4377 domain-containing protein n=1 Tax=Stenotrophomonas sp. C3(2023) TaxID=3080277 RepID=UPI00293CE467|nr:META and DUF4377 domain-containing protein [Stenotrophomonas sp. C3(2023)]MDV3467297.1 META and DUF4377 domain-containing protein [Stenotrophomonas sp. C3(2023)]
MKRTLSLILPLALLAACSDHPAPVGATDDLAPGAAAAASQRAAAQLDAQHLQGQHWLLQDATGADGKRIDALFARSDKPVTLLFADGRVSVDNACNRMGGSYTVGTGTLTVGPMVSTEMACAEPAMMALDKAVGSRLQGELKTELSDGGQLTLRTGAGDVLVFAPEPTAETRYGGPGEIVFLEVAPQTKLCPHPLIKDKQCLQVREVRFDENGIRQGEPGEYTNFYDTIQGYEHEAGTHNVLRVKRFKIDNPPADASALAYVLDMVVETSTGK